MQKLRDISSELNHLYFIFYYHKRQLCVNISMWVFKSEKMANWFEKIDVSAGKANFLWFLVLCFIGSAIASIAAAAFVGGFFSLIR